MTRSSQSFNVPDYLLGEIEAKTFQDLAGMMQMPVDLTNDKQSVAR
jgi:hypothetical protein